MARQRFPTASIVRGSCLERVCVGGAAAWPAYSCRLVLSGARILHADSAGGADAGSGQLPDDMVEVPGEVDEKDAQFGLPGFRHTLVILTAKARMRLRH